MLGLSFVLLTLVFRSIVIAATAIVLNLLSVGAAYGLIVLVFQHGVGAGLVGFQQSRHDRGLGAAVPLRRPVRPVHGLPGLPAQPDQGALRPDAVDRRGDRATASRSTARLITGAALIIVAVFLGFATGDLVMFQQMGFGVAVALLIDATIIRSVLLPAAMTLLGDWNWYLPRWLEWMPRIQVEDTRRAAARPVSEHANASPRADAQRHLGRNMDTHVACSDRVTMSVSSSRPTTVTGSPLSAPSSQRAAHSSPWTRT